MTRRYFLIPQYILVHSTCTIHWCTGTFTVLPKYINIRVHWVLSLALCSTTIHCYAVLTVHIQTNFLCSLSYHLMLFVREERLLDVLILPTGETAENHFADLKIYNCEYSFLEWLIPLDVRSYEWTTLIVILVKVLYLWIII